MGMVWLGRAAAFFAAAVTLSIAPGVAQAAKGSVTISHMAMTVDGRNEDSAFFVSFSGGFLKVADGAPVARCFLTDVGLPDGATPKTLRVWATGLVNNGVLVNLSALNLGPGTVTTLFSGTRGDESGDRVQISERIVGAAAASNKTAYSFSICLDPGESFSGARVEYTTD